jgi:hypothetical protein
VCAAESIGAVYLWRRSAVPWLRVCPVLLSIFFAVMLVELQLGLRMLSFFGCVERNVPTTALAKPPSPGWRRYEDKTTLILPLHSGDR